MYPYKNRKDLLDQEIQNSQNEVEAQNIRVYNRHHNKNTQNPDARYIPPNVIADYVGEVINTYIPGYGRRNVYVAGISRDGMVSLIILHQKPQDCISVHYSDLSGIGKPQFKCR